MFSTYMKATVGAVVAALAVAGTAAIDNSINLQEGIYIASAFLVAFGGVWATPNRP
jgi:uncharacterized membrane protein